MRELKKPRPRCRGYGRFRLDGRVMHTGTVTTMPTNQDLQYDVFLSRRAKDKAVVRPLAERLRHDGLQCVPQPSTISPQPASAPLNRGRCFIPLRLDDATIKGSLEQFLSQHE